MSTASKAKKVSLDEPILQGDVFKNVRYNYIDSEDNDSVRVIEFEFPMAIIISQACDVVAMDSMITDRFGKPTKFLPSVLLCPIYDKDIAKSGQHIEDVFSHLGISSQTENLFNSNEYNLAKNDWHYRFHALTVISGEKALIENALIDFKHYFCVPMSYLVANKTNRLFHIESLFAEQITLKFATFLSRVAIP